MRNFKFTLSFKGWVQALSTRGLGEVHLGFSVMKLFTFAILLVSAQLATAQTGQAPKGAYQDFAVIGDVINTGAGANEQS